MNHYKSITLLPGDRLTRSVMREAHDAGRHGDGTKADVVAHWATCCADCSAVWRYDFATATRLPAVAR